MNIRADTKRFFTGTGQQYYADLPNQFPTSGECASSSSSVSGVNALSFAGRFITKVAMKPLRWRSMVPCIRGHFLAENRGDSFRVEIVCQTEWGIALGENVAGCQDQYLGQFL